MTLDDRRSIRPIGPIPLETVEAARARIAGAAIRTPLLPLYVPGRDEPVWLKLECLQPIGSFKIRGAANAIALAGRERLSEGVYTASAGNMAQGVAFAARQLGIPCRVIVPDTAPRAKLDAIERLGATAVPMPFEAWWSVLRAHGHPAESGLFIHPVSDPSVIAGNGTIGLEILEDLPDVDTIFVPWGGGGLACGIASAVKASRPSARVLAAEVDTAAPLAASLAAGGPRDVPRVPTFVDGIGGKGMLPEMWPLASNLIDGSVVVSIRSVCEAIRMLAGGVHVVAEGAGGAALAAAMSEESPGRRVVVIVSGGNIDTHILSTILQGKVPRSPTATSPRRSAPS